MMSVETRKQLCVVPDSLWSTSSEQNPYLLQVIPLLVRSTCLSVWCALWQAPSHMHTFLGISYQLTAWVRWTLARWSISLCWNSLDRSSNWESEQTKSKYLSTNSGNQRLTISCDNYKEIVLCMDMSLSEVVISIGTPLLIPSVVAVMERRTSQLKQDHLPLCDIDGHILHTEYLFHHC